MGKLTSATRNKLPSRDFAVPGRKYPVNDRSHARNALARVAQHGTPKEKAEVKAKVEKKFPGMEKGKKAMSAEKKSGGEKKAHAPAQKSVMDKGGMKRIGTHSKRSGEHHKAIGSHEGYTLGRKKR